MFIQDPSGFFCCEPGMLGVSPSSGITGGLCEPVDQHVPTPLLATVMSQVGVATPAPKAGGKGNSTATGGGGSGATQTNPSLSPTSTNSGSHSMSSTSNWGLGTKVGLGAAVIAAFVLLSIVGCGIKRRHNKMRYALPLEPGERDELGILVPGQPRYSAYEPYRRQDGNGNNVTVNVVHGGHH